METIHHFGVGKKCIGGKFHFPLFHCFRDERFSILELRVKARDVKAVCLTRDEIALFFRPSQDFIQKVNQPSC